MQASIRVRTTPGVVALLLLAAALATPMPSVQAAGVAIPNGGQYITGANSVVWQDASGGTASATTVASAIQNDAGGLNVSAMWMLDGNSWQYYLPRYPSIGSLRNVGPLSSLIVVLESQASTSSAPAVSAGDLSLAVAQRINAVRASNGLGALQTNGILAATAAQYASFLDSYGYPQRGGSTPHSLDGEPWDRATRNGYSYRSIGEVISWSSVPGGINIDTEAQRTVDGWLNSPPHRAIILGSYTEFGVGCVIGPDTGGRGATYTKTICVGMTGVPR